MDLSRGESLLMLICSIVSMFSTLPVLISFALFWNLRKKANMHVVYYLTLSNFLTSLGSSMGEPFNHSGACLFQAYFTNIFTLSSLMWSIVMSYVIHEVVFTGKIPKVSWKFHFTAWGIPMLVTFLPLISNTYGAPGGFGSCRVVSSSTTIPSWQILLWLWASFYGWMVGGIIVILSAFLRISFYAKTALNQSTLLHMVNKIKYYPMVIVFTNFLRVASDVYQLFHEPVQGESILKSAAVALSCLLGFFTSFLFFYFNGQVRRGWWELWLYGIIDDDTSWTPGCNNRKRSNRLSSMPALRRSQLLIPNTPPTHLKKIEENRYANGMDRVFPVDYSVSFRAKMAFKDNPHDALAALSADAVLNFSPYPSIHCASTVLETNFEDLKPHSSASNNSSTVELFNSHSPTASSRGDPLDAGVNATEKTKPRILSWKAFDSPRGSNARLSHDISKDDDDVRPFAVRIESHAESQERVPMTRRYSLAAPHPDSTHSLQDRRDSQPPCGNHGQSSSRKIAGMDLESLEVEEL